MSRTLIVTVLPSVSTEIVLHVVECCEEWPRGCAENNSLSLRVQQHVPAVIERLRVSTSHLLEVAALRFVPHAITVEFRFRDRRTPGDDLRLPANKGTVAQWYVAD